MPRAFYSEFPGAQQFGQAVGGGSAIRSRGARSATADMANLDWLQTRADLAHQRLEQNANKGAGANVDLKQIVDAIAVRQGVPAQKALSYVQSFLGGNVPDPTSDPSGDAIAGPSGIDPELEKVLRGEVGDVMTSRVLTGKTNFPQLRSGQKTGVQTDALKAALDQVLSGGADTTDQAQLNTIASGRQMKPYSTNPQGTVLDTTTGALDESGDLAAATRALIGTKAEKEQAHADLYDAKADTAHATKTGKAQLGPAEQQMFNFYREAFPDESKDQTFNRVKARRGADPGEQMAKDQRAIKLARPRWTADQVNEEARKYQAGRDQAAKSKDPEVAKHVDYLRAVKRSPELLRNHVKKLKDAGYGRDEVSKMLQEAGIE